MGCLEILLSTRQKTTTGGGETAPLNGELGYILDFISYFFMYLCRTIILVYLRAKENPVQQWFGVGRRECYRPASRRTEHTGKP